MSKSLKVADIMSEPTEMQANEIDYRQEQQHQAALATRVREDRFKVAAVPIDDSEDFIDADTETREITLKYPVEQMVYGREIIRDPEFNEFGQMTEPPVLGNMRYFDFKEGHRYRVPRELAAHLYERGFLSANKPVFEEV